MILVDERQGSVELAPLLSSSIVCHLDYGDFAWSGKGPEGEVTIGVERKRLMDLLQSMTSGRLSGHQIIGMLDTYDWTYLLVEGLWRPDRHTGVLMRANGKGKWEAAHLGSRRFMARDIYNFFNTLTVMTGIIVVTTGNIWESAKWLESCSGWWNKGWAKHKSHTQWQKPPQFAQLTKPNLVTRMAAQLEGIGWDKARKIGERFDSVDELIQGVESEFTEVEGIGPKLAESIVRQIQGG